MVKKKSLLTLLVIGLLCLHFYYQIQSRPHRYHSLAYLSTLHTLQINDAISSKKANAIWQEISELLQEMEQSFSYHLADSELQIVNRAPSHQRIEISQRFRDVFMLSHDYYVQTNGYFDPSVLPYMEAWGFFGDHYDVPSLEKLESIRPLIGLEKWKLEEWEGRYFLTKSVDPVEFEGIIYRQSLDFGAILKGYLCDQVLSILRKNSIQDAFFQAGISSVALLGQQELSIKDPDTKKIVANMLVENTFVSTSGDEYRYFEKNGIRYSHFINPFTGQAKQGNPFGISVFSSNGSESDVLASMAALTGNLPDCYVLVQEGKIFEKNVDFDFLNSDYEVYYDYQDK